MKAEQLNTQAPLTNEQHEQLINEQHEQDDMRMSYDSYAEESCTVLLKLSSPHFQIKSKIGYSHSKEKKRYHMASCSSLPTDQRPTYIYKGGIIYTNFINASREGSTLSRSQFYPLICLKYYTVPFIIQ